MYPILFRFGSATVYSYGFLISLGIVAGMLYLIIQGKKEVGLTFDKANALFLYIFLAAIVGGKLFLFFEDPAGYRNDPRQLFAGRGFVFYGSFLLAVPTMWWFFKKNKLHPYKMLDVMAITTCLVHVFGRLGCFLAGCCHGKPTSSIWGVTYTDPICLAEPLHTPLYPTQLFEALYIFFVMIFLLSRKRKRRFYGQLFLSYLVLYAVGRFMLEFLRGDTRRGFLLEGSVSHSQLLALGVIVVVAGFYMRLARTSANFPNT